MKSILSLAPITPVAAAVFALASMPVLHAETVTGPITLRGEMQNAAKPGSISFVYQGQLTARNSGDKVNVSGGGLFRSLSDEIVDTAFTGELTSYRRFPTSLSSRGRLVKLVKATRVTVSRRFVRFPGASITLDRAINPDRADFQRIRGKGRMTFQR